LSPASPDRNDVDFSGDVWSTDASASADPESPRETASASMDSRMARIAAASSSADVSRAFAAAVALAVETFAVASRKAFTVASPTGDLPPSPVPSPYPALGRKYPPADDISPSWPVSPDIPHGGARFERRRDRNHDFSRKAGRNTGP